ncbi:hypothetical protein BTO18_08240 [Polaribacter porphyrae]|uniref:Uncharacterized protein n=1 Tax=Polaribacter porphyrae TaxID=1137780 RepID=A0A2S7WNG7_9FLAO|nr:hypothetical protein BTO18_08240 [Polaribacter porphyrae]
MKTRYLNLFWVILAVVIIINELRTGYAINFIEVFKKHFTTWIIVLLWFSVALKNFYSFTYKTVKANQK